MRRDAPGELEKAAQVIEAEYRHPYLAHAAMEPLNCVIQQRADGVEVWNGEQNQTNDQNVLAKLFGIKPEQVRINIALVGKTIRAWPYWPRI